MRKLLIALNVIIIIMVISCSGTGEKKPVFKPLPKEVNNYFTNLSSDNWGTRQMANTALLDFGEKLIEQYRSIKLSGVKTPGAETIKYDLSLLGKTLSDTIKSSTGETKQRAENIAKHLYRITRPKIAFNIMPYTESSISITAPKIVIMDENGLNLNMISRGNSGDSYPMWSADGKKIVFTSARDFQFNLGYEIYVADQYGRKQTNLSKNAANDKNPAWNPDGKKIIFTSDRGRTWDIYTMDASGENQQLFYKDPKGACICPVYSPNGKKVAFVLKKNDETELCVIDSDGKNMKPILVVKPSDHLLETENSYCAPSWSYDNKRIILHFIKNGVYEIYAVDASGQTMNKITSGEADSISPDWAPNGNKVIFNIISKGIYIMDKDGKNTNMLERGKTHCFPRWSPSLSEELSQYFKYE